jgi:Family of unknown function (DUF6129)
MPLPPDQLHDIKALLQSCGPADSPLIALRERFPGLTTSRCDAADIDMETPLHSFPRFDLHLIDGRGHCWRLTEDPDQATGVLIAMRGRGA